MLAVVYYKITSDGRFCVQLELVFNMEFLNNLSVNRILHIQSYLDIKTELNPVKLLC